MIWNLKLVTKCQVEVNAASTLCLALGVIPLFTSHSCHSGLSSCLSSCILFFPLWKTVWKFLEKNTPTILPSHSTPKYLSKKIIYSYKDLCKNVHRSLICKNPRYNPNAHQQNKQSAMKYYSAIHTIDKYKIVNEYPNYAMHKETEKRLYIWFHLYKM